MLFIYHKCNYCSLVRFISTFRISLCCVFDWRRSELRCWEWVRLGCSSFLYLLCVCVCAHARCRSFGSNCDIAKCALTFISIDSKYLFVWVSVSTMSRITFITLCWISLALMLLDIELLPLNFYHSHKLYQFVIACGIYVTLKDILLRIFLSLHPNQMDVFLNARPRRFFLMPFSFSLSVSLSLPHFFFLLLCFIWTCARIATKRNYN